MFDFKLPDLGPIERVRTLDLVARWLVGDLISRTPERDPVQLTDAAFAVMYPELGGRRIKKGETALIDSYKQIRRTIVEPLLGKAPSAAISTSSTTATTVSTDARVPAGYKKAKNGRGLARYSIREDGLRLEDKLRALRSAGKLVIDDEHIDTYQRISNVETSGGVQALNTWDAGVVSIGFMQLTLMHDKLQNLIALAPDAFRKHQIELEPERRYTIGDYKPRAIKGVTNPNELRWGDWADRFYLAGLEDDVIVAAAKDAEERLGRAARVAKDVLGSAFDTFWAAYRASLPMRGLYQEATNNLPAGARKALQFAAKQNPTAITWYATLKQAVPDAFGTFGKTPERRKDFREKGEHIRDKTAVLRTKG